MDVNRSGERAATFRKLKVPCVALSKITVGGQSRPGPELLAALRAVLHELQEATVLDAELANYVFFPLARVFSAISSVSAAALEVSLRCLRILIARGWANSQDASLCKQLLILLSFITDPSAISGKEQTRQSDVVTIAALDCLLALFEDASALIVALCRSENERPIAVLGQTISALLTVLRNDYGPESDLRASSTIKGFVSCVQEEALLLSFLPGIVSALTRYAAPRRNSRKPARSFVKVLETLTIVLSQAFSSATQGGAEEDVSRDDSAPTQDWREAQAAQVSKALTQLVHLRYHENEDVRLALLFFCTTLLRDCLPSLQSCAQLLLSTSIYICGSQITSTSAIASSIYTIVASSRDLRKELDVLMQEWLTALPRLVLEGDRDKIQKQCDMLVAGFHCSSHYSSRSTQLCGMVLRIFQDSVSIAIRPTPSKSELLVEDNRPTSQAMTVRMLQESTPEFKPLGYTIKGGAEILNVLQQSLSVLANDETFREYSYQVLADSVDSHKHDILSSLWLARQMFWRPLSNDIDMTQFLTGFELDSNAHLDEMDAIYSQAVGILSDFDEDIQDDWRLQAMSLEIVAVMARQQGTAFQSELVDVLFPVIERIGSAQPEVRERALTCLNVLASSCGAGNAGELVVQNADYLVNSMALKLNAFEVSAQAPKVMVMVIYLCGPSLIPYLDDILASIFSALSSYHGYPRLVDALFSVLEAIVEQSSSPASKLIEAAPVQHKANRAPLLPVLEVVDELKSLKRFLPENIPGEDSTNPTGLSKEDENGQEEHVESKDEKVEPSKTYQMVRSIARHSQYYLTHSSAGLRQRLLKLMSTACTSLSRNEDQYLPLLNDVWPVIVTRLYDSEATVSMEAMESMKALFESAGDFLLSRTQSEWPRVLGLGKQLRVKVEAENRGKGGRGSFSMTYQLLERYADMLLALVTCVGISGEMEDDIFALFFDHCERASVRHLLDEVNADAYWLLSVRSDKHRNLMYGTRPGASGFEFHNFVV